MVSRTLIPMIKIENIYRVVTPFKGWPVQEANNLDEATQMILGSPYWAIPQDVYKIVDQNDTYSLLAVYDPESGRASRTIRYLAVNMHLQDVIEPHII